MWYKIFCCNSILRVLWYILPCCAGHSRQKKYCRTSAVVLHFQIRRVRCNYLSIFLLVVVREKINSVLEMIHCLMHTILLLLLCRAPEDGTQETTSKKLRLDNNNIFERPNNGECTIIGYNLTTITIITRVTDDNTCVILCLIYLQLMTSTKFRQLIKIAV